MSTKNRHKWIALTYDGQFCMPTNNKWISALDCCKRRSDMWLSHAGIVSNIGDDFGRTIDTTTYDEAIL